MPTHRRPLIGAFVLALFITACLAWFFVGIGKPLPWWGSPLVFAVFSAWLYAIGRLLLETGRHGNRVRSFDVSIEGQ